MVVKMRCHEIELWLYFATLVVWIKIWYSYPCLIKSKCWLQLNCLHSLEKNSFGKHIVQWNKLEWWWQNIHNVTLEDLIKRQTTNIFNLNILMHIKISYLLFEILQGTFHLILILSKYDTINTFQMIYRIAVVWFNFILKCISTCWK